MKQSLEDRFKELGFTHPVPLAKGLSGGTSPLCHYIDVLLDSSQTGNVPWTRFINGFVASRSSDTTRLNDNSIVNQHAYTKDNDKRSHLIHDFCTTEMNYIASLNTFLKVIVHPLRARTKDKARSILGAYECNQIFMNIDDIYQANKAFGNELKTCKADALGALFSQHLDHFKLYHHFLVGIDNAKSFHSKEFRNNVEYNSFLERIKEGSPTVYDYLLLPVQRLGHYKLFLQGLLDHTPKDHPDFQHLVNAQLKLAAIASMPDDYHTKLIHIFQSMLQAIQGCPASLISQQRSLIATLDVVEYDVNTLKPVAPITLFLFSDKIMAVRRPSFDADALDLCGLYRDAQGAITPATTRKSDMPRRIDKKLKFRGWLSLGNADVFHGLPEIPASFMLVATKLSNSPTNAMDIDQMLENYFHEERVHLFGAMPTPVDTAPYLGASSSAHSGLSTSSTHAAHRKSSPPGFFRNTASFAAASSFIQQFGHAKMTRRCQGSNFKYLGWQDHHFYINQHELAMYHTVHNKNDTALLLISEKSDFNAILQSTYTLPPTLLIVAPAETFGYVLSAKSQHPVQSSFNEALHEPDLSEIPIIDDHDLAEQLLCNVVECEHVQAGLGQNLGLGLYNTLSPSPSSSSKSVRDTIKQLNRRKSFSAINRLISGTVQATGHLVKPPSPNRHSQQQQQHYAQQRPRSASYYLDPLSSISTTSSSSSSSTTLPDELNSLFSNKRPVASSNSSEVDSLTPTSSFLNYRASILTQRTSMEKLAHKRSSASLVPLSRPPEHTVSSSIRPSVHPSQTMSYDIKSTQHVRLKANDGIENRVKQLCNNLAQGSSASATRFGHAEEISPHFAAYLGASSSASLIGASTGSSSNARTFSLAQDDVDPMVSKSMTMMKMKQPPKTPSPVSLASLSGGSPSPPAAYERLGVEVDQLKSDFDKRLGQVVQDYEQSSQIVHQLQQDIRMVRPPQRQLAIFTMIHGFFFYLIQQKDEEIMRLREKYDNSIKDNNLLYEVLHYLTRFG
ncbi:hypothetical protein BC940DRAFT_300772, partial [Gongronella butleri]